MSAKTSMMASERGTLTGRLCRIPRNKLVIVLPGTLFAFALEFLLLSSRFQLAYEQILPNVSTAPIIISVLLIAALLVVSFSNVVFDKWDALKIGVICLIALWGLGKYSILYAGLFSLVFLWGKIRFSDLTIFFKILIVVGFISCLLPANNYARWEGFAGSPTIFALILSLAVVYLIFATTNERPKAVTVLFIALAYFMIWKTGTRVYALFTTLVILYGFFDTTINAMLPGSLKRYRTQVLLVVISIVLILAFSNISSVVDLFARDNGAASNSTRFGLYEIVFTSITSSPQSVLFGSGGGSAMSAVSHAITLDGNMPIHQDVLAYICDYGLIGFSLIAFAFFYPLKWTWYMWVFLLLSTFHNVATSGVSLLFIFITFQSIQYKRNSLRFSGQKKVGEVLG